MRMRRKKNLVPRMERCAQWLISDPQALRGNWRSLLPGAKELRIELGCGKGRFTCQTAAAAPEEMLEHPATQQVRDFLGSHVSGPSPADLTAADVMRTGVVVVNQNRGIHECVSRMQHHNVDTLLVVDEALRYQGTVSIADIRLTGHVVKTIGPLVRNNTPTVGAEDNAKDCFDLLASSGFPYLVVLSPDRTVAGIITKTSMAAAMAEHLWG